MKKFTITYTNDSNSTNLTLTTSDANLVVDVVTQLECHADDTDITPAPITVSATSRPEVQVETVLVAQPVEDVDPNRDAHPISLRRWTIHNYQRVADMSAHALFNLQQDLVREGIIRQTCTMSSVKTYQLAAVSRLNNNEL